MSYVESEQTIKKSLMDKINKNNFQINKNFSRKCEKDFLDRLSKIEEISLIKGKVTTSSNYSSNHNSNSFFINYNLEFKFEKGKFFYSIKDVENYFKKNKLLSLFGKKKNTSRDLNDYENGSLEASFTSNPDEGLGGYYGYNGIISELKLEDNFGKNFFSAKSLFLFNLF